LIRWVERRGGLVRRLPRHGEMGQIALGAREKPMRPSASIRFALLLSVPVLAQAQVQPGMWESSVTVQSVDMPGAPPQIAAMMKGKTTRQTYCITAEQARQGPQEMLKQNASCRFTKYDMAGGRISTEMSCRQNEGTMTARALAAIRQPRSASRRAR
jgi:hypothetical protein